MPSTATPRVWTVFVAYAAAWGVMGTAGGVLLVAALLNDFRIQDFPDPLDPQALEALMIGVSTKPWFVLASVAISSLSLAGIALVAAKLSPAVFVERLRLRRAHGGKSRFLIAPLAAVAALTAGSAILSVLTLVFGKKSDALVAIESVVHSTGPMFVLTFVLFAVAAPLGEELFFRGYAQTRLVARYGRSVGVLIATGLFALLHFDPMHVAVAYAIGAVLAWTTERTGSIRSAIFAHAANNGLFVLGASSKTEESPTWVSAAGLSLVAVVALAGIAVLTRVRTGEFAES
jgi:membrane protease YdiL (CAAX protease family)